MLGLEPLFVACEGRLVAVVPPADAERLLAAMNRHPLRRALEGGFYFSVTVEDDPGRDLGAEGRPGHRFCFRPDEVDPQGDV